MKLFILSFLFVLFLSLCSAQVLSNYGFSYSEGTYEEISGGYILGNESTDNQYFVDPDAPLGGSTTTGVGFPIGFSFYFNGYEFDRVAVSPEGWISLGMSYLSPSVSMVSSSRIAPLGSTSTVTPTYLVTRFAALAGNLAAQSGASLRLETVGTAPNRELVVQWSNYRKTGATGDSFNFQIRLQESSDNIVYVYGTMTSNSTPLNAQIGFRGEPHNTAANYRNRMTASDWSSTTEGSLVTSSSTLSDLVYPVNGATFTWTPPTRLSGVYTISATGDFTSFTDAFNFLNTEIPLSGIGLGGIIFNVPAGQAFLENPPVLTSGGAENRIILFQKSGEGINPVIKAEGTTATNDAAIRLDGAIGYTFDGIDIANADGETSLEYAIFLNAVTGKGCRDITVKNGKYVLSASNTNTRAIYSNGISGAVNANLHIDNIRIENSNTGIYLQGSSNTLYYLDAILIENCTISDITSRGIHQEYGRNSIIRENLIEMYDGNTIEFRGIYVRSLHGGAEIYQNDISGNNTTRAFFGIHVYQGDYEIYENEIRDVTGTLNYERTGIFIQYGNAEIYENHVHSISGVSNVGGISIAATAGTCNVYRNRINNIASTSTSSRTATGVTVAGSDCTLHNNMIYDIINPDGTTVPQVRGITVLSGSVIQIYYNSVFLKTGGSNTSYGNTCLYITSDNPVLDLRNNIFANQSTPGTGASGRVTAIWKTTAGFDNMSEFSDRNIYYAGTPGAKNLIAYAGTTPFESLLDYKNANIGTDQGSFTENVPFVSVVEPYDLHVRTDVQTRIESNALPIDDIDFDFDNDLRDAETPDIGADEGDFMLYQAAPEAAVLNSPEDSSILIEMDQSLNWTASLDGGIPDGYLLHFGTDGNGIDPPTNIINGLDLGNVFMYEPVLGFLTTYYWQIIPYNNIGQAENCPIWSFTTHDAPLTGIKTVGSTGYYPTLSLAVRHLNAAGVGEGGVTFAIASGEEFIEELPPIVVSGTEDNPILFRSDAESRTNPLLRPLGGTNSFGFRIEGGDHITFDGIDITNRLGADNLVYGYQITGLSGDGCQNITIKNCNITLSRSVTSYGIYSNHESGAPNMDISYLDNNIDEAANSIYHYGRNAASGIVVRGNIITNTTTYGIYLRYCTSPQIYENEISFPASSSANLTGIYTVSCTDTEIHDNIISGGVTTGTFTGCFAHSTGSTVYNNQIFGVTSNNDARGINFSSGTHLIRDNQIHSLTSNSYNVYGLDLSAGSYQSINITAYNNVIHNLTGNTSSARYVYGIRCGYRSTTLIYNNFIYDLNNASASTAPQIRALGVTSGTTHNIYHNSVYLDASGSVDSFSSAALYISSGTSVRLNNNIFVNKSNPGINGRTVSFWKHNAGFGNIHSDSNRNIYYTGEPDSSHLICYHVDTPYETLDDYKAANSGKDQGSFTENVPFISTVPPYDLHIRTYIATRVEGNANPLAAVEYDIDGDERDPDAPDIGADEGEFIPVAELPSSALVYEPEDEAIVVIPAATLTWIPGSDGGIPSGYIINIGTDYPPSNIEDETDLGNVLEYSPPDPLDFLTTYYWQIIPYNNEGSAQNCPVWSFTTHAAPLTGIYTIGSSGDFPSFTLAIRHLNAAGVGTGGVIFEVAAAEIFAENPPSITVQGTASNQIIFRSDSRQRTNPLLTPTGGASSYGIKIEGGDYITFDGIDIANLPQATNLTYGYWIAGLSGNGALWNTIVNCNITLSRTNTATRGIYSYGASNGANSNLSLQNNNISNVNQGILLSSSSSSTLSQTILVQENVISDVTAQGILHYYGSDTVISDNQITMADNTSLEFRGISSSYNSSSNAVISDNIITGAETSSTFRGLYGHSGNNEWFNNTVTGFTGTSSSACYGIYINYGSNDIYGNQIHDLTNESTIYGIYHNSGSTNQSYNNLIHNLEMSGSGSGITRGITITGGATNNIFNNMIYDLRNPDGSASPQIRALEIGSGTTNNIYYNSILLNSSGSTGNHSTASLYISGGSTNRLLNNIFSNLSSPGIEGRTVAFWKTQSGFTNISEDTNNNIYYAGIPSPDHNICYHVTTPYEDLDSYKAANTGKDQSSFSENVPFAAITNPYDLHVREDVETRVEGNAIPISGIDFDFDDDERHSTAPDIGADEGDFLPVSGPPAPLLNLSPANLAVNASLSVNLIWSPGLDGGLPTSYNVYFGDSSPPPQVDTVTGTTYSPVMEVETTYFWRIEAVNIHGEELGPIWSFTTRDDYTIYDIPYTDSFENDNAHGSENIRFWQQEIGSYTRYWSANTATSYNRTPRTGDFNITLAANGNCWLFRPAELNEAITYDLEIWARQNSSNYSSASLEIWLGSAAESDSMSIEILSPTGVIDGDYQQLNAVFSPPQTDTYVIGIRGICTNTTNYLSIDDITLSEYVTTPGFAIDPTSWNFGMIEEHTASPEKDFEITNTGDADLVILLDGIGISGTHADHFELLGVESDIIIPPAESTNIQVRFIPQSTGIKTALLRIEDNTASRAVHQIPLTGRGTGILDIPFVISFEENWEDWLVVNGTQTNKWHTGDADSQTGEKSAYISNNNGIDHGYTNTASSVVHFYHDISFPGDGSDFKLRFDWKGVGEQDYDFMTVHLTETGYTPSAGTPVPAGSIGEVYYDSSEWQSETIDLSDSLADETKRLIFSWQNDSGGGEQPPAAVDNIRIVSGSDNDIADVIAGTVEMILPQVTIPDGFVIPELYITDLSGGYVHAFADYAPDWAEIINPGLSFHLSGTNFSTADLTIVHNLNLVPLFVHYRILPEEEWTLYPNPEDWTDTEITMVLDVRADDDLQIVFPGDIDPIPPIAMFSSDVTSGLEALSVHFTDESEPGNGELVNWQWDFGDGGISELQNPVYIYETPGIYNVSLKVTNEYTLSDSLQVTDYITVIERVPVIDLVDDHPVNLGRVIKNEISEYYPLMIINSGTRELIVNNIEFEDDPLYFELQDPIRQIELEPEETLAINVRFAPQFVGTVFDTLVVYNNSVNEPVFRITLQGYGTHVPPKQVQNISIDIIADDLYLTWDEVTENIHEELSEPDCYFIYLNTAPSAYELEDYEYLDLVEDTSYIHLSGKIHQFAFYYVVGVIFDPEERMSDDRGKREQLLDSLRLRLKPGMRKREVDRILRTFSATRELPALLE
jgi:parallel beta-helix repeat protein